MTGERLGLLVVITRMVQGGAQREVLELLANLDRARFHVSLACSPGGEWVERGIALADAFYPIPDLVRPISPLPDLRAAADLMRVMKRARPDIVHTHTSKAGMLGRFAAVRSRIPAIVHTPHGTIFHGSLLSRRAQRPIACAERAAARWTGRIVTKSDHESDEYVARRIAAPEKFHVIRSGLDFHRLDRSILAPYAVRAALGLSDNQPLVLCPARLVPEKDHICFLRAFGQVLEAMPSAVAVLAGDGPLRGQIEAQASALIQQGALVSLGFRDDLPDLMRAADVCVNSSLTEGLPLAVAEALALARPVVATDVGGTREIVRNGETGLLVPSAQPAELARAIVQLLRQRDYALALGRAGRNLVRGLFTVQGMVDKTTALYDQVLDGSRNQERASRHLREAAVKGDWQCQQREL